MRKKHPLVAVYVLFLRVAFGWLVGEEETVGSIIQAADSTDLELMMAPRKQWICSWFFSAWVRRTTAIDFEVTDFQGFMALDLRHIVFFIGGRGLQGPWFKNSTLYMTFFCIFLSFPVSQEMKMKIQNFAHRYVPKRKWLKYPTALRFRWSFLV